MILPLIFFYHRLNCYSFNALAGAIDADPSLADLQIDIALRASQLRTFAADNVRRHGHAVVALSILTCQSEEMLRLIRQLRSDCGSRVTIAAGGPHVTACADEVLASGADVVFCGEAEVTFADVLRKIAAGQKFQTIQLPAEQVDLDTCFSFSPKRGMFGPIEITRGCAFACSYCQTSRIFGARLRHRSIDTIVRQAEALRSVNRKVVRLLSPNAFSYGSTDGRHLNLNAIRDLLSALRSRLDANAKIIFAHFPSEVRPEHVLPETLDLLKEFADNDEIVIGAQSGSSRMLDACHRSHDVESVLRAVTLARKYGYKIIVDFIFGLPGETASDLSQTLAVIEEVVRMGARIHPHTFAPLPQTPFSSERPGSISPEVMEALERFKSRRGVYG
ncbi:MAG: TIGR04013 family B12-binding domain/radical SAM domain-containing protein [Acidobacteriota bacterium]|jgi:B12-binding domain/radical SAM domain protein